MRPLNFLVLSALLANGMLGAEYSLIERSEASYKQFVKGINNYVGEQNRVLTKDGLSNDMRLHNCVAYTMFGEPVKAHGECSGLDNKYLQILPYSLKRYFLDAQISLQEYGRVPDAVNLKQCLSAKNLAFRKECRYYLGVSLYLASGKKDKNYDYAAYYYPNLNAGDKR